MYMYSILEWGCCVMLFYRSLCGFHFCPLLQVDSIYPELAELLVVVIKMLLSKSCEFTVDEGTYMYICTYAYLQPRT